MGMVIPPSPTSRVTVWRTARQILYIYSACRQAETQVLSHLSVRHALISPAIHARMSHCLWACWARTKRSTRQESMVGMDTGAGGMPKAGLVGGIFGLLLVGAIIYFTLGFD